MGFGGWGFTTYLHEIGHTLGLSHPGTYDAGNGGTITYANNAEYAQDSLRYTVMSYFDASDAEPTIDHYGASGIWKYAQTPLLHDIAAIQAAYGADTTTRTGDTVYGFNSNAGRVVYDFAQNPDPILVIWDSGGTDTLDCSGYSTNQLINLTAGSYSNIGYLTYNVAIAFNCTVENAIGGTGADTINGNSANNVLQGGNGADTIDGADGNDTLNGGAGNDTIWGGAGDDTFVYSPGADTIKDFTVGAGGVDEIDLRGVTGVSSLADVLARATQSGAHTVINFGGGNTLTLENINRNNLVDSDFLFSGPPAQSDLTASGVVLNGASISFTINNAGAGAAAASTTGIYLSTDSTITSADTLVMSVATAALAAGGSVTQGTTLTLPGNLTPGTYYLGVLADYSSQLGETNETNNASNTVAVVLGNGSANTLNGTAGSDTLFGLAGDDWIYGGVGNDALLGGDGVDHMSGGAGADVHDGGAGYDYVRYDTASSGVTASLGTPGANTGDAAGDSYIAIEGMIGSNFSDALTGDGAANDLWGLDGNDTLNGGAGFDAISGGAGDDTFVYSTGADAIRDFTAGAGGVDEIDLRALSSIASLADVLARATQVGANTVIDFGGGNTLTLENINRANLVSSDFLFASAAPPPPPAQNDLTASGVVLNGANISFTINNTGADAAAASTTGIYLSTDSTITSADTLVMSVATAALAAGGSVTQGATLTLPGNLTPGTYYLGVLADYSSQLGETNETNNASNTVAVVLGNSSANTLNGTAGSDTLFGLAGDDWIYGGVGNDALLGGDGVDHMSGGAGADIHDGGAGYDYVRYDTASSGVTASLGNPGANTGDAAGDSYIAIEGMIGSNFSDALTGDGAANDLWGLDGNDTLNGGAGFDALSGGAGDDTFVYSTGADCDQGLHGRCRRGGRDRPAGPAQHCKPDRRAGAGDPGWREHGDRLRRRQHADTGEHQQGQPGRQRLPVRFCGAAPAARAERSHRERCCSERRQYQLYDQQYRCRCRGRFDDRHLSVDRQHDHQCGYAGDVGGHGCAGGRRFGDTRDDADASRQSDAGHLLSRRAGRLQQPAGGDQRDQQRLEYGGGRPR